MTFGGRRLNRREALLGAGVVSAGTLAALMPETAAASMPNRLAWKERG